MEKYGFVYIWYDIKRKMYYIGSHWGFENDGYVCSSNRMREAYRRRPADFKRRIISKITTNRLDLLEEEQVWLSKVKRKDRYYNLNFDVKKSWWSNDHSKKTVSQKISEGIRRNGGNEKIRQSKLGDKNPMSNPEVSEKVASKNRGRTPWNKGVTSRDDARVKKFVDAGVSAREGMIVWNKGKKMSDEYRDKQSKTWLVTKPDGTQSTVINLKKFCEEEGLSASNLMNVAYGKRKSHKGYKCLKLD